MYLCLLCFQTLRLFIIRFSRSLSSMGIAFTAAAFTTFCPLLKFASCVVESLDALSYGLRLISLLFIYELEDSLLVPYGLLPFRDFNRYSLLFCFHVSYAI